MAYDNNNSGIISKNDRKEQPNHPDYKGSAEVSGTKFWISAWIKERKDGSGKFLSLSFTEQDQQKTQTSSSVSESDAPF